ncbi:MAG: putative Zn-dependent protease [Rhodothermales bacterium]|jgi:predicted Zn-dependent protease
MMSEQIPQAVVRNTLFILFWSVTVSACDSGLNPDSPLPVSLRFDTLPPAPDPALADYQMWNRWPSSVLTWALISDSGVAAEDRMAITTAVSMWEAVSAIKLKEDSLDSDVDILIGYSGGRHCDLYAASNRSVDEFNPADCPPEAFEEDVLGHTYQRWPGHGQVEVHLRVDHPFVAGEPSDSLYRLATALHHVGHALGLGHSTGSQSVMGVAAASIDPISTVSQEDALALETLYGPKNGIPPPGSAPSVVPAGWRAAWCSLISSTPQTTPEDEDGDGVGDQVERFLLGTDPGKCDTDKDEVSDMEALIGLRALDPDTDGDGRADGLEVGTDRSPFIPGRDPYYVGGANRPPRREAFEGTASGDIGLALTLNHDALITSPERPTLLLLGTLEINWNDQRRTVPMRGGKQPNGLLVWTSADYHYKLTGWGGGVAGLSGTIFIGERPAGNWSARYVGGQAQAKLVHDVRLAPDVARD